MTRELPVDVRYDHSQGMRVVPECSYNRQRTVHLRFLQQHSGFLVQAWGSAFPEDGAGGYQGQSTVDSMMLHAGVADLRACWQRLVIEHADPGTRPARRPFVDGWDLATPRDRHLLDDVGIDLARAGYTLFRLLFHNGDAGLKDITDHLVRALRDRPQVITVESDWLFVPWNMLYVPMSDDDLNWGEDDRWTPDGFWSYRHVVEHGFTRSPGFDSRIVPANGAVSVGINVDRGVDGEYPPTPCVSPIIDFFDLRASTTVRTTKTELAAALQDTCLPDEIIYFGCHGGNDGGSAHITLGDNQKIYSTEIHTWLAKGTLPARPVVFVGTCQGGQLASSFYPTFGRHLLRFGARSLIGPQIDLPRAFAREYATRLFAAFLEPNTKLGDIVRGLARMYLDQYRNPLGLIFSLYRGMDVHLSAEPYAVPHR